MASRLKKVLFLSHKLLFKNSSILEKIMSEVYTLSGYLEEVTAHAFAKTSRSPQSFKSMIKELTQEKSDSFHSKWVLDYGHNSIAEHAVIHLAVEDISRAAMAALESGRLASYTEQSTRYQPKTTEHMYCDPSWNHEFASDYKKVYEKLFDIYEQINSAEKTYGNKLGFTGYDFSRFALPLGVKVNAGVTINARSLRRTLCKMLASELPEIRVLAEQIQQSAYKVAPTLLRHVKPCEVTKSLQKMGKELNLTEAITTKSNHDPISVSCDKFDVNSSDIVAGLAYEYSDMPWKHERWINSPMEQLLDGLGVHDAIPRAFEEGIVSFEVVSDYGSFYDMKRHRLMSLLTQHKSLGELGYVIPGYEALQTMGLLQQYIDAMETVAIYARKWVHMPEHIYFYPNAYRIRYKMTMNPRELIEIIKIRGLNKKGHTSYRYIGLKMLEIAIQKKPELFAWINKWLDPQVTSIDMIGGYKVSTEI